MAKYGFNSLQDDAFKQLAAEKGAAVVGDPLHDARYVGDSLAYQYCEKGVMEAVKLDDDSWRAFFIPFE